MPELPEVEIARRNLQRWLQGRTVVRGEAEESRVFRGADLGAFRRLHGRLLEAGRRGKYLLLTFEEDRGLLAHLGMTGKFLRRRAGEAVPHSRARLVLDDGHVLHLSDPRMFGRLEPVPAHALASRVADLGLDPLVEGVSAAQLREALAGSRQDLKVALMDQARVAGLGNIHAAEALFRAGLHPARKPAGLGAEEWARLAAAIRAAIAFGLAEQEGEDVRYLEEAGTENRFLVYGRAGTPCTRCGARVESLPQGGRTTHFCPRCQPLRPPRGPPRRGRAAR